MAKTYNTLSNVTVGSVLTASDYNEVVENSNNYRVPPNTKAGLTANISSYTSNTAIAWTTANYDTESPSDPAWAAGSPTLITIRTAGIYVVTLHVEIIGSGMSGIGAVNIDVSTVDVASSYHPLFGTTNCNMLVAYTASLSVGATLRARATITGGGTLSIGSNSYLAASWVGQVS
jgi:hypothetical protein